MSKYRKKKDDLEYAKELEEHKKKIAYNIDLLSNYNFAKDYEHLSKLMRRGSIRKKLFDINRYAYDNLLNPSTAKDGNPTFFVSNDYLVKRYKGAIDRWNRIINTHYFLGLLEKYSYEELQDTMAKRVTRNNQKQKELNQPTEPICHYYIPKYDDEVLREANEQAKQLIEKGYTIAGFGSEWLKLKFGMETADRIYPNNTLDAINALDEPAKSAIAKTIISEVKRKGYTTPTELKSIARQELYRQLQRRGLTNKVDQVYRLYIHSILDSLGYTIRNADKELQERFNLKTHIKIIYKPD